jgi:hypothetical protein
MKNDQKYYLSVVKYIHTYNNICVTLETKDNSISTCIIYVALSSVPISVSRVNEEKIKEE